MAKLTIRMPRRQKPPNEIAKPAPRRVKLPKPDPDSMMFVLGGAVKPSRDGVRK